MEIQNMRKTMRLLKEKTGPFTNIIRDWLTIDALESVLLSFFKGGSTLMAQPIPILSPAPGRVQPRRDERA